MGYQTRQTKIHIKLYIRSTSSDLPLSQLQLTEVNSSGNELKSLGR